MNCATYVTFRVKGIKNLVLQSFEFNMGFLSNQASLWALSVTGWLFCACRARTTNRRYCRMCCLSVWIKNAASSIPAVPPSGRRRAALQPCDRTGDQTGHDGQQDQLRQRQPWQVRTFLLLWSSGVMNFANWTHNLVLSWSCYMACGSQHSVYRVQNQGGNNRFHQGFRVEGGQRQKRTSAGGESATVLRSRREAAWEGVSVFVWKKTTPSIQLTVLKLCFPLQTAPQSSATWRSINQQEDSQDGRCWSRHQIWSFVFGT